MRRRDILRVWSQVVYEIGIDKYTHAEWQKAYKDFWRQLSSQTYVTAEKVEDYLKKHPDKIAEFLEFIEELDDEDHPLGLWEKLMESKEEAPQLRRSTRQCVLNGKTSAAPPQGRKCSEPSEVEVKKIKEPAEDKKTNSESSNSKPALKTKKRSIIDHPESTQTATRLPLRAFKKAEKTETDSEPAKAPSVPKKRAKLRPRAKRQTKSKTINSKAAHVSPTAINLTCQAATAEAPAVAAVNTELPINCKVQNRRAVEGDCLISDTSYDFIEVGDRTPTISALLEDHLQNLTDTSDDFIEVNDEAHAVDALVEARLRDISHLLADDTAELLIDTHEGSDIDVDTEDDEFKPYMHVQEFISQSSSDGKHQSIESLLNLNDIQTVASTSATGGMTESTNLINNMQLQQNESCNSSSRKSARRAAELFHSFPNLRKEMIYENEKEPLERSVSILTAELSDSSADEMTQEEEEPSEQDITILSVELSDNSEEEPLEQDALLPSSVSLQFTESKEEEPLQLYVKIPTAESSNSPTDEMTLEKEPMEEEVPKHTAGFVNGLNNLSEDNFREQFKPVCSFESFDNVAYLEGLTNLLEEMTKEKPLEELAESPEPTEEDRLAFNTSIQSDQSSESSEEEMTGEEERFELNVSIQTVESSDSSSKDMTREKEHLELSVLNQSVECFKGWQEISLELNASMQSVERRDSLTEELPLEQDDPMQSAPSFENLPSLTGNITQKTPLELDVAMEDALNYDADSDDAMSLDASWDGIFDEANNVKDEQKKSLNLNAEAFPAAAVRINAKASSASPAVSDIALPDAAGKMPLSALRSFRIQKTTTASATATTTVQQAMHDNEIEQPKNANRNEQRQQPQRQQPQRQQPQRQQPQRQQPQRQQPQRQQPQRQQPQRQQPQRQQKPLHQQPLQHQLQRQQPQQHQQPPQQQPLHQQPLQHQLQQQQPHQLQQQQPHQHQQPPQQQPLQQPPRAAPSTQQSRSHAERPVRAIVTEVVPIFAAPYRQLAVPQPAPLAPPQQTPSACEYSKMNAIFGIKCSINASTDCCVLSNCNHELGEIGDVRRRLDALSNQNLRKPYRFIMLRGLLYKKYFVLFAEIFGIRRMRSHLLGMIKHCCLYPQHCTPFALDIYHLLLRFELPADVIVASFMQHYWSPSIGSQLPELTKQLLAMLSSADWYNYLTDLNDLISNQNFHIPIAFLTTIVSDAIAKNERLLIGKVWQLVMWLPISTGSNLDANSSVIEVLAKLVSVFEQQQQQPLSQQQQAYFQQKLNLLQQQQEPKSQQQLNTLQQQQLLQQQLNLTQQQQQQPSQQQQQQCSLGLPQQQQYLQGQHPQQQQQQQHFSVLQQQHLQGEQPQQCLRTQKYLQQQQPQQQHQRYQRQNQQQHYSQRQQAHQQQQQPIWQWQHEQLAQQQVFPQQQYQQQQLERGSQQLHQQQVQQRQQQVQQQPLIEQQQQSSLVQQQSSVVQQLSLVQQQPSLVQQQPSLVQQQSSLIQQQSSLIQQQPLLVQQQSSLVQQQPLLVQQQSSLLQQRPSLVQQQPLLVQQQLSLVQQQQQPLLVQQQPSLVQQQPLLVQQQPSLVQQQPLLLQQQPSLVQQQPSALHQMLQELQPQLQYLQQLQPEDRKQVVRQFIHQLLQTQLQQNNNE